jgi:hypothetical protein
MGARLKHGGLLLCLRYQVDGYPSSVPGDSGSHVSARLQPLLWSLSISLEYAVTRTRTGQAQALRMRGGGQGWMGVDITAGEGGVQRPLRNTHQGRSCRRQ